MEIRIRKATKDDMPRVRELIVELAVYEKEPDAVEVTLAELETYGFGDKAMFTCFLAEVNNTVVGMALVYFKFSTWKGRVLYLEDLIVTEQMRGKGVGKKLYEKVMEFGKDNGVKRVDWVVISWNKGAVKFYEQSGAKVLTEWHPVEMDAAGISNIVANK